MWPHDKEAISGEDMISVPVREWETNHMRLLSTMLFVKILGSVV